MSDRYYRPERMWTTPPDPISLAELRAAIGSGDKSLPAPLPHDPAPTVGARTGAGDYPPSAVSSAAPSGEPFPVQASQ
ncbi:MAG: hypothetical protein ACRDPA_35220, partial [Solirubrobacteraceae bacterium]